MIVTMKNVRRGHGILEELHDRALKEYPAVGLIGIILRRRGIDINAGPVEESIAADEEDVDRRIRHLRAMDIERNALESKRGSRFARDGERLESEFLQT